MQCGGVFAPVIEYVVNIVYQLMKAIQSLVYAFTLYEKDYVDYLNQRIVRANGNIEKIECTCKLLQFAEQTTFYNTENAELEIEVTNNRSISKINEEFVIMQEKINDTKMKLLWQNTNTAQEFLQQTITLVSDQYDILKIFYRGMGTELCSVDVMKKSNSWLSFNMNVYDVQKLDGIVSVSRGLRYVDDTHISFTNCNSSKVYANSAIFATDNASIKPIAVYGYKV